MIYLNTLCSVRKCVGQSSEWGKRQILKGTARRGGILLNSKDLFVY